MPKRDKSTEDLAASSDVGTIIIEADSVEEAMTRLATEVGETAEIVEARKVHRGGIGGFFAKERVQLTARAADESANPDADPDKPEGLAGVLDRMTRNAEAQETEFATMLRQELGTSTRDLGLDTFLEAVGWDDKTSADEAEKAHTALGEITAAMTTPLPTVSDAETATAEAAPDSTTDPVLEDAVDSIETATESASDEFDSPNPPPIVIQRVSLDPDVTPRTPTEDRPATFTPMQPRAGVVTSFPGPSLVTGYPDDELNNEVAEADTPQWRITEPGTDPAGLGPVAWSTMDLVRQGIPTEIVTSVADIDPNDDVAWITGLADAIAPYCGPLPDSDSVIVGPNAEDIADALGIGMVEPGQTAPYEGSFASVVGSNPHDKDWLEFVRGKRLLHYAIGTDQAWRQVLVDVPTVISWIGEATLMDALYLAVAFDATLGYGVLPGSGGSLTRVYPVDVALAIRSKMARS